MKKIAITAGVFFGSIISISGQIGINTQTPNSTLDVVGKPDMPSVADGLIIPRLSGDQLASKNSVYDNLQNGAMVYVTEPVSTANQTDKTVYVTTEGVYYYSSSEGLWNRVIKSSDIIIPGGKVERIYATGIYFTPHTDNNALLLTYNDQNAFLESTSNISGVKCTQDTGSGNYNITCNVSFGTPMLNSNYEVSLEHVRGKAYDTAQSSCSGNNGPVLSAQDYGYLVSSKTVNGFTVIMTYGVGAIIQNTTNIYCSYNGMKMRIYYYENL